MKTLSLVKVLLKLQVDCMGTLGDHGKRREHRNMTLLVCPPLTVLSTTRFSDQWENTSTTSIDPFFWVERKFEPRCVRRTLPKSRRRTQRGERISGRCQVFDEIGQSGRTRGYGKTCSKLSRCQPMIPSSAMPCGLREPGDEEITSMSPFYRHLKMGTSE